MKFTKKQIEQAMNDINYPDSFTFKEACDMVEDFLADYADGADSFEDLQDCAHEFADRSIPVYNNELWEKAPSYRWEIEEAIEEGLVDVKDADLMKVFQAGIYLAHNNLINSFICNLEEACE